MFFEKRQKSTCLFDHCDNCSVYFCLLYFCITNPKQKYKGHGAEILYNKIAWLLAFPVHELANAYVLVCIITKNKVRITSAGLFSNFIFIKNTNLSQG
jgi:hypothetical protein